MVTLLKTGERVAFVGDPRITGTVVGFGYVDNGADERSTDSRRHDVVIVALDVPMWPEEVFFPIHHTPIMPDVLTLIRNY